MLLPYTLWETLSPLLRNEDVDQDGRRKEPLAAVSPLPCQSAAVETQLTSRCFVECDDWPPIVDNIVRSGDVSLKRRSLQEPHSVIISQGKAFFIVTAVKTPNLTRSWQVCSRNVDRYR
jgi:hypothetical protein